MRSLLETLTITVLAIAASLALFSLLMFAHKGIGPLELIAAISEGGFGTKRSWMNTLAKAAPLLLTALCTALPARLGLVIIGGEGALIAGGLAAAIVGPALGSMPFPVPQIAMILSGMLTGALVIAFAGALRHFRGVNATICSLLLTYIMLYLFNYLIEGPLLFSKTSNKFSSAPIPAGALIGKITGLDVHWGLVYGLIACFLAYILMDHTTFGFAARMAGGNVRAAQGAGLPVGRLILITCLLGGAAAGLAGVVEVAAVHKQGNSGLYAAGFGYTGILVSFIARHHPLGIIPAAILFGGLKSSSDELQMSFGLPDASVDVFAGTVFVMILLSETLYGRIRVFQPPDVTKKVEPSEDEVSTKGEKASVVSAV